MPLFVAPVILALFIVLMAFIGIMLPRPMVLPAPAPAAAAPNAFAGLMDEAPGGGGRDQPDATGALGAGEEAGGDDQAL